MTESEESACANFSEKSAMSGKNLCEIDREAIVLRDLFYICSDCHSEITPFPKLTSLSFRPCSYLPTTRMFGGYLESKAKLFS